MATAKWLSNRRLALVDDLSAGDLAEQQVLDRHDVGRQVYYMWLAGRQFVEEVNQCAAAGHHRNALPIARNARSAAAKLVRLANSENPETARKACLDIITIKPSTAPAGKAATRGDRTEESAPVSPETASRLLAVLAKEKDCPEQFRA